MTGAGPAPSARRRWHLAVATLAAAIAVTIGASCAGDSDGSGSDRPRISVTTTILGDTVANVVGDAAEVDVLLPIDADPHDFALSVRQVAELRDADLIVTNGLGFEAGLADAVDGAEAAGVPVLHLGDHLDPRPLSGGGDAPDPHWFTDPVRMADAAELITDTVIDEIDEIGDRGDSEDLQRRGTQTSRDLMALDAEIRDLLDAIPDGRRELVTNHEVFDYFAARYDLDIVGTVVPGGTTGAEASPSELADLVDTITDRDVPAIFADASSSTDLADALADEVGRPVQVVRLFTESLGPPGSGGETYVDMMLTDATRIRDALA